ncbi:DnaJ domain-containing protein [Pseudahrensia aquimaris]|uniref:DnaJ domain-containing protein n=1 Tax=Pseudahrensia aquimaris TaxID=744461 RepID=A0ABW3FK78_9HYPH
MTSFLFTLFLTVCAFSVLFLMVPAATLARFLRYFLPGVLIAFGSLFVLTGRFTIGGAAIFAGIALWRRLSGVGRFGPAGGGGRSGGKGPDISSVRSAALEMELNHDSGEMNGVVLAGRFEGRVLDELTRVELIDLLDEVREDSESVALLDAYLDRRFPAWREDAHFDGGPGQTSSAGSGPMSEEEAYEVLGLSPGTGPDEIRKAHRRLMKRAHPDSGGSTFLAAKINEAKDVLLKRHT